MKLTRGVTRRCPMSGKTCYPNRGAVEHVRRRAEKSRDQELRVYGCPDCGFFHLTSRVHRRKPR